jgi:hypothetical protein
MKILYCSFAVNKLTLFIKKIIITVWCQEHDRKITEQKQTPLPICHVTWVNKCKMPKMELYGKQAAPFSLFDLKLESIFTIKLMK